MSRQVTSELLSRIFGSEVEEPAFLIKAPGEIRESCEREQMVWL